MRPSLWGPAFWRMMLACAWKVDPAHEEDVQRFLLELVPDVLPCETCAEHYRTSISKVNRAARGRPGAGDQAFRWCWYMKHEVNQRLGVPSVHLADLVERYLLHGPTISQVEIADVLVLCAIQARATERDDAFVAFCAALATLLDEDDRSVFVHFLRHVARPIIPTTLRLARSTRHAHGRPRLDLLLYTEAVR